MDHVVLAVAQGWDGCCGMTQYRKGPQRTTKDRKGPTKDHKRPTKDRKGALRAKLQEIGSN